MSNPRVSVIMAAFNAGAFIHQAIRNLQQQTMHDWELIVVDDCSEDNTPDVVRSFMQDDARIRYFRQPENKGPSAARNTGFLNAQGHYITILDADDAYMPERLDILLREAPKYNIQAAFVYELFDEKNLKGMESNFGLADAKGIAKAPLLAIQNYLK